MSEIAKMKFEILEFVISQDFTIDGLSDKLNELTNSVLPYNQRLLDSSTLIKIHPELTKKQADSLLAFAKSKTISHLECYGDGSIIYPKWNSQFNER